MNTKNIHESWETNIHGEFVREELRREINREQEGVALQGAYAGEKDGKTD